MDSFWEIWIFHEKVGRKKNKKKRHDWISSRKFFPTPKISDILIGSDYKREN